MADLKLSPKALECAKVAAKVIDELNGDAIDHGPLYMYLKYPTPDIAARGIVVADYALKARDACMQGEPMFIQPAATPAQPKAAVAASAPRK